MSSCPALLDGRHYLEPAPPQDFAQGSYRSVRLVKENIERERGGAGADQYRSLAFMQRTRKAARTLPHHAIYHTVEQHLQLPRHIAPITGRTYDQDIASLYQPQGLLGIIIRQDASQTLAASHTARTRLYRQIRYVEQRSLHIALFGLFSHRFKHPGDIALTVGTPVNNQYIHNTLMP